MKTNKPEDLKVRKTPQQTRSEVTVDAILQATIQVLVADGVHRLSTTHVAARAGVSVGTMYQYFPHKQSLLSAVLQKHLGGVAESVETVCRQNHGQPIAGMLDRLVGAFIDAFIDARTIDHQAARAIYRMSEELGQTDIRAGINQRLYEAIFAMLANATDMAFDDLASVTLTVIAALVGTASTAFDRGVSLSQLRTLQNHLIIMIGAYLRAAATGQVSEIDPDSTRSPQPRNSFQKT